MSLGVPADVLLAFVGLYPVVTAAVWIAGGLLSRLLDEPETPEVPTGGWPPVTVLIPAYNEREVIGTCVRAVLGCDYPQLRVLVLDDGSQDGTAECAEQAAAGDPRARVVRDRVNRGKAERLNRGFELVGDELVLVTDADTHMHPMAPRRLVAKLSRSPLLGAVAGAPHVTNRQNVLAAMQILEAASIIGLIRRTQSLNGRVGVVAGVLGIFRRSAVLEVGGFAERMATEDIDLSWRLLLAGWHTAYEPRALVGMEVPATLPALWAQRRRWARGQGEVLNVHLGTVVRWRHRGMWPLALEALASLVWVIVFVAAFAVSAAAEIAGASIPLVTLVLAWGVAVAVVCTLQLAFALQIDLTHDRLAAFAFLLGPLFAMLYWMLSAAAAVRSETSALLRGPAADRVAWNIQREQ